MLRIDRRYEILRQRWRDCLWRISDRVENSIALNAVIVDSCASPNHKTPSACDIPGNAESRTPLRPTVLEEILIDAGAGLADSLEWRTCARNFQSDIE